jgi:hypothetical protein
MSSEGRPEKTGGIETPGDPRKRVYGNPRARFAALRTTKRIIGSTKPDGELFAVA